MTQEQYIIESARTCKDMGSKILNQVHMILGITGEFFGELVGVCITKDRNRIKDETGDVLWYLAGLARTQGLSSFTQENMAFNKDITVYENIGNIAEVLKKNMAYEKPYDDESMNYAIYQLYNHIVTMLSHFDIDVNQVMQLNIEKLKARFPDKFEADLAINKDNNIEQKVFDTTNEKA